MSNARDRSPRAPQLTLELQTPKVSGDVFSDEARYEGLLVEEARYTEAEADGVELREFALTAVDLSGAKLDGLDLEDGAVKACNLANLQSAKCTFERVEIEHSRLTGATFVEPRLTDVVFRNCPADLSSFRFGRLRRVRFEACRLNEADFQGITATACTFVDCDMTGVQLSHANFAGSAIRGCSLSGVRGVEALRGTEMAWEDVLELASAFASSLDIAIRDDIS